MPEQLQQKVNRQQPTKTGRMSIVPPFSPPPLQQPPFILLSTAFSPPNTPFMVWPCEKGLTAALLGVFLPFSSLHNLYEYAFVSLSDFLSVCLFFCLSECLTICASVPLSAYLSLFLHVCLFLSVFSSVYLSFCPLVCLPSRLSDCSSVCLSLQVALASCESF